MGIICSRRLLQITFQYKKINTSSSKMFTNASPLCLRRSAQLTDGACEVKCGQGGSCWAPVWGFIDGILNPRQLLIGAPSATDTCGPWSVWYWGASFTVAGWGSKICVKFGADFSLSGWSEGGGLSGSSRTIAAIWAIGASGVSKTSGGYNKQRL